MPPCPERKTSLPAQPDEPHHACHMLSASVPWSRARHAATPPPRMLSVSHSMAFSRTSASGSVASGLFVALGECLLRLVRLVRVGVGGRPVGPPILLRFGLALTFLAFLVFGDGTRLAALDGGRSETVAALGSAPKATRHSYTSEWPMAAAKLRHTGTHSAHRKEEEVDIKTSVKISGHARVPLRCRERRCEDCQL